MFSNLKCNPRTVLAILLMGGLLMTAASEICGQTLSWSRQDGTNAIDLCNDAVVDIDGNVVIVGRTDGDMHGFGNFGGSDIFVRKYSPSGAVIWTRQFGTQNFDEALAVTISQGDRVFVTGVTNGSLFVQNAGGEDAFILRLRGSDGATVMTSQFGTPEDDQGTSIQVAENDEIFVAGSTLGKLDGETNGGWDCYVGKFDIFGNEIVIDQFGSTADDFCNAMVLDPLGQAILTGETWGNLFANNQGLTDLFVTLLKITDSTSTQVWGEQLGTSQTDQGNIIDVFDDSLVVIGATAGQLGSSHVGSKDIVMLQFDLDSGGLFNTVQVGSTDDDIPLAADSDSQGNIYFAGGTDGAAFGPPSGNRDVFLYKTSHQSLTGQWFEQFGSTKVDVGFGVCVDEPGTIFVAGSTDGNIAGADGFFDPFLTKFVEPYRIKPGEFNTFRGILVSGDLSDVWDSDNSYLKFNPGLTLNSNEFPVWILFGTQLPTTPSSLNLYFEAQADTPGLQQVAEIYNWVSAEFEVIDIRAASFNNDQTVVHNFSASDISKVVSPDDDSISVRVGWRTVGPTLVFPWEISIDYLSSEIEN